MENARIAIVEDDPSFIAVVTDWLSKRGYACQAFTTGAAAKAAFAHEVFDLYLIDWQLPDTTGDTVLAALRAQLNEWRPVIFVTVHDGEDDILRALHLGCDDYFIKPPRHLELLARIEGLLRRRDESVANAVIEAGAYRLAATQAWMNGDAVELSAADLQLARLLFGRVGQLLSKDVMAAATGFASHREVDEAMSRLRKTLAIEPANGHRIVTVSGFGYRLERL